jgi:hypothetical protein
MKAEKRLMDKFKIDDNLPLAEKKEKIDMLIKELESI